MVLARVVAGVIFPVGLMLVVFTGSELFTGNCLMIIPTLEKKIKPVSMIKNLVVVYISNFVGAMIIDLLILSAAYFVTFSCVLQSLWQQVQQMQ